MNGIFNDLVSGRWWISVVIVGFLINLASAYLKPAVDKAVGRFSASRRNKNEQKKREFERAVADLLADRDDERDYRYKLISDRLQSLEFLMAGLFLTIIGLQFQGKDQAFFGLVGNIFYLCGLLTWLAGMRASAQNSERGEILREVNRRKQAIRAPEASGGKATIPAETDSRHP